jgi:hypothetical protein
LLTVLKIPLKTRTDIDKAISTFTRKIQTAASTSSSRQDFNKWEQSRYPFHRRLFNRATRASRNALKKDFFFFGREVAREDKLAALEVFEGGREPCEEDEDAY